MLFWRHWLAFSFLTQSFHIARKSLVAFAIFAKFADFSKLFLAFSLCKCRMFNCKICYSCYFCHIYYSIFSHSKKKSCYFCDFCKICYFFYTFLIAVFFKSFFPKLRRQFASKFLLTRSILDTSEKVSKEEELVKNAGFSLLAGCHQRVKKGIKTVPRRSEMRSEHKEKQEKH